MRELLMERYEKSKLLKQKLNELEGQVLGKKTELQLLNKKIENAKERLKQSGMFFIEKRISGERCFLHKRGNEVKILSTKGTEINIPKIEAQALSLSKDDFILDCKLTTNKNRDPVIYAFDCLLFGEKDLTNEVLGNRKSILKKLKFTGNIKELASVLVKNKEEAKTALGLLHKMSGSLGAIAKKFDSEYCLNEKTSNWIVLEKGVG